MRSLDFFVSNRPILFFPHCILSFASVLLIGALIPSGAEARSQLYKPPSLQIGRSISEQLSNRDIPTGQGSFARDYVMT